MALRRPYAGESPRTTLTTTPRDDAAGAQAGTAEAFEQMRETAAVLDSPPASKPDRRLGAERLVDGAVGIVGPQRPRQDSNLGPAD
jgi:hypothetical protein